MAMRNYRQAKRNREESKKKKQQEKLQRKQNRGSTPELVPEAPASEPDTDSKIAP